MSVSVGNKISNKNSIVFLVDFTNKKSFSPNLLNYSSWFEETSGSVSEIDEYGVSIFNRNGAIDENVRVLDVDPFGYTNSVVWKSSKNADTSFIGSDGGWNTNRFKIDNRKMYRFSVWTKRNSMTLGSQSGTFYFGTRGYSTIYSDEIDLIGKVGLKNEQVTNPYFHISRPSSISDYSHIEPPYLGGLNVWTLVVGHVWPFFTATSSNPLPGTNINGLASNPSHPDTGVWTINGGKVGNTYGISGDYSYEDWIWNTQAEYAIHRSYHYYSTDRFCTQSFIYPRVDIVDGFEPTISELLSAPEIIKDISKNSNRLKVKSVTNFDKSERGIIFSGRERESIDGYMSKTFSVYSMSIWFNPSTTITETSNSKTQTLIQLGKSTNSSLLIYLGNSTGSSTTETINIASLTNSGSTQTIASVTLNSDTWYNLCINWNGSDKYDLYINGNIYPTTGVNTLFNNCEYVSLCGRYLTNLDSSPSFIFNGKLSSVTIYDKSQSEYDILQNYNSTKSKYDKINKLWDLNLDAGNVNSYSGTGITWFDLASGNNGTLVNGPTYDTANGGSILFDGIDDRISNFPIQFPNKVSKTIDVWFKTTSSDRQGLCGTRDLVSTGWVFTINRTSAGNLTYFHTGSGDVEIPAGIITNVWYNAVVTHDYSTGIAKIYLNGNLLGSGNVGEIYSSLFNGVIGDENRTVPNFSTPQPFKGNIAKVSMYNRVLTNSEISNNFNLTKSKYIISDNLLLNLDSTNNLSYPETGNTWYGIGTTNAVFTGNVNWNYNTKTFNTNSLFHSDLNLSLSSESVITLEVWINMGNDSLGVILSFDKYHIWINTNGIGFNSSMGDLYGLNKSTIVNSWKQVTFVIRNGVNFSNNKIYLNGVDQSLSVINGAQNITNSTFTNQQRIFGRTGTPIGHIDSLNNVDVSIYRIYKRELTQSEIINNFNIDRNKFEI